MKELPPPRVRYRGPIKLIPAEQRTGTTIRTAGLERWLEKRATAA